MVGWSTYHLADIYAGKEKKAAEEGGEKEEKGELNFSTGLCYCIYQLYLSVLL